MDREDDDDIDVEDEHVDEEHVETENLLENDVTYGRGNKTPNTIGNARYNSLIRSLTPEYSSSTKILKAKIIRQVYNSVGRFLTPIKKLRRKQNKLYHHLSEERALYKIYTAFLRSIKNMTSTESKAQRSFQQANIESKRFADLLVPLNESSESNDAMSSWGPFEK